MLRKRFSKLKEYTREKLLKIAFTLSLFTIGYNLLEGSISTILGFTDDTLALFGFGLDSFVEVISGIGIAHMVWRIQHNPVEENDYFERQALRITGIAFYILTVGLVIGATINIFSSVKPETTVAGIVIASISILIMYVLYWYKLQVGKALDSPPIISDANCTKTCFYLSFVVLISSVLYEFFKIPYVDAIGSLGVAWFAFREGKEAFEKVKKNKIVCSDDCC